MSLDLLLSLTSTSSSTKFATMWSLCWFWIITSSARVFRALCQYCLHKFFQAGQKLFAAFHIRVPTLFVPKWFCSILCQGVQFLSMWDRNNIIFLALHTNVDSSNTATAFDYVENSFLRSLEPVFRVHLSINIRTLLVASLIQSPDCLKKLHPHPSKVTHC